MRKLFILFAALLWMHSVRVHAQYLSPVSYHRDKGVSELVFPPSPESASCVKYADVPFTHSTGMAELSVPLYVLEGKELSIPVSLDYRSGGIKLDEVGGVAGLGWSLSVGGCVTREVVYLPDEYKYQGRGLYDQPSGLLLTNLVNGITTNEASDYLKSVLWNQVDCGSDRYSYSVGGCRGTFVFSPAGEIKHLSGDGAQISCTRDSNGVILSFTITDPDGTVYTLSEREIGTCVNASVNPTPFTGVLASWTAPTAWLLTRIDSRDGLEYATLSYKPAATWVHNTESHTQSWSATGDSGYVSSGSHGGVSAILLEKEYQVKALSSITFMDESVQFVYASESSQSTYAIPGHVTAWNYPYRLTGIQVSSPGHPSLVGVTVQTGLGASNRVVLSGLQVKRDGVLDDQWTFSYITSGGSANRYGQDWFGYCNGESGRSTLLPYGFSASSYLPSLMYGYPNASNASFMMLSSANHNGAVTEYEYEGNTVFSGTNVSSIGVRVKKITVKNGSETVRVRQFTYSDATATAGSFPSRSLYSTVSVQQEYDMHLLIGMPICVHYNWTFTMHDSPVVAGPSLRSSRVIYGRVEENVSGPDLADGSSRTVYEYDTSGAVSWTGTLDRFPSTWSPLYNSLSSLLDPMLSVPSGYGEERERSIGLLTRREEWRWTGSGYELSESEDWTYETPSGFPILTEYMVHQVMHRVDAVGGDVQPEDLYHYPVWTYTQPDLSRSRVVRVSYHEHGNDTTVLDRTYMPRASLTSPHRIKNESMTCGGVTRNMGYTYADELTDPPQWAQLLADQHALGIPLKRTYMYFRAEEQEGNGAIQVGSFDHGKSIRTEYGYFPVGGVMHLLPSCRVETTGESETESWREDYLSYDFVGNVSCFKERGRPQTVVLWGYQGRYPVAVIENASLSDVRQAYGGQSYVDALTISSDIPSEHQTRLEGLRNLVSAHVTTMTYDPGVGITSITSPAGVKTYYEYDSGGRLSSVKDAAGHTVESFTYNLLNPGTNRLSMRHKVFRSDTGTVSADDVLWWNTLGMKTEAIALGAGGQGADLVSAYEGDYALHDDVRSWLPYPVSGTQGQYQTGAATQAANYHSDNKAYHYRQYEVSPSGRLRSTALPGYAGSHETTYSEDTYQGMFLGLPQLEWENGLVVSTGVWLADELVEENTVDADGRRVSVAKDLAGRTLAISRGGVVRDPTVVLIGNQGPEVHGDPLPTYYVYDKYDRLCAVVGSGIEYSDTLNMWRYSYDALDRLSSKGIPGAEREFYTYDSEDNVISIRQGDELREMEYNNFGQVTKVYLKKGTAPRVLMEEHEYGTGGLETYAKLAEVDGDGAVTGYAETEYTYDSKARLISAVTEDVLGGTLTESYTYNFPGDVTNHTTSYAHGTVTDALSITYDYDIRGRMVESVSTLSLGGSTSSSVTTQYSYDALGRPSGQISTASGTGGTLNKVTVTDGYTLQGWLSSHQVKKGTQTLFTETLKYDTPSSTSGGNALYTGLISERSDQWKFASYGQGVTTTDGYRYDNGGRLTYVKRGSTVGNFSYDARGNILSAEGNSYTYSGDRVSTFTPFGQSAVYFTHDSRGRMTYDGASGVTIDYNYLNLTRKISGPGGTLVKYSYLADGSKTSAENGSGEGLVYRGSLIYKKASNGTLTFDGASIPEGRLLSGATRLYVTDHLGSVKAVVNGNNGNLYEVNNYTVYGKQSANSSANSYISTAPTGEKFRDRFTGKEDQTPDFTVPFTDFGARQYSPVLRRWLVPDPLSEKYYGVSPYAYCAGDPVNLVDLNGASYSDFDIKGNYLQTTKDNWWHNLWHGRTGRIVDDNGNVLQSFRFADPKHDVADLKAGKIDRIQFVQENEIISMLSKAGAFSEENKAYNNDIVDRYAYILKESPNGGKFDFALTGIPTLYNNYDQSLFLVNGVAHNRYNYGNFIWGAAGKALGLTLLELRAGAHFRALVQNGEDGYPSQFDSRDDQFSIREGVKYANAHNYMNVFYRVAVGSLKIVGNVY